MTAEAFHVWTLPDGTPWAAFHREGTAYLLRFPGFADFHVAADGLTIAAHPVPGVSAATLQHLYLNQVLPLALSRQFKLVLHAGAVEIGTAAVAFLGSSGSGKSTLTTFFATQGYRFMTDDGLQIDWRESGHWARPGHDSIRLWDDSRTMLMPEPAGMAPPVAYTPKTRLLAGKGLVHCNVDRPLRALYLLGDGSASTVTIQPAGTRDAMIELVRHSFLLDIEERAMLEHQFRALARMVTELPCFRLDYPRQFAVLPQVKDALLLHLTQSDRDG